MKTCNSKIKAPAFLGAALMLLIALLFTGCPQRAKPKPKHTITFGVDGTGGTLKATVNSGNEVEEGKTVTFTAKADAGYRVKEWKLGGTVINNKSNTYALTVTAAVHVTVSFEPKKAILTLEAGKNTVKVKAKTADGKPITVEGCNETELANEAETTLTVTNPERKLALIGDIIELNCSGDENVDDNRPLAALDVTGCAALQKLNCQYNKITALNVQGLTALQELNCKSNQLSALDVSGLTALQTLYCNSNQLTALNVQGLKALKELQCNNNDQLATLDVQGCTALKVLDCYDNKLNADVFTKLFNDLPERKASDGAEVLLYNTEGSEGNCKNFTTPENLKKAFDNAKDVKHWKMQKANYLGIPSDI